VAGNGPKIGVPGRMRQLSPESQRWLSAASAPAYLSVPEVRSYATPARQSLPTVYGGSAKGGG